jgi:hypothetical protein
MPFKLDEQVRRCYERASSYRDGATAERDPQLRQHMTDLEMRWLNLAQSYEISRQLLHVDKSSSRAPKVGHATQVNLDELFKVISEADGVVERGRVPKQRESAQADVTIGKSREELGPTGFHGRNDPRSG